MHRQMVNSPLSSQLKAAAVVVSALASKCERVSRRYNERAFLTWSDAAKRVFYTNQSGTTEAEAFVSSRNAKDESFFDVVVNLITIMEL